MRADRVPLTIEQVQQSCPAVFTEQAHPTKVSDKYTHIPTAPVLQAMLDAGYGVSRAQQTQARGKAAQGYARHLLAFRPASGFVETRVGGAIPEVVLLNSHDGQCSYRLDVGVFRLVCANGMIVGDSFDTVKIKHRGNIAEQVVEETTRIFETYVPKLETWVAEAEHTKLTKAKQKAFAEVAQAIRFSPGDFDPALLLDVRREADQGDDLWSVFNRIQENLMRGGIQYKDANGANRITKPLNRITKDVIFNRRLWDAANEYLPQAA